MPVDETPTTIVISPLVCARDAIPDVISIEPLALPVDFPDPIATDPLVPEAPPIVDTEFLLIVF